MKLLLAMSGGVDSSAALKLLLDEGHSVTGVTFVTESHLVSSQAVKDAKDCAEKFGIEHRVLDFTDEFREKVKEYFISTYENGGTPNPCVICNREIKFGILSQYARAEGFDAVATGHYVKTVTDENGRCRLYAAADLSKDQSYMLAAVPERELAFATFPLGDYTKDHIRRIAGAAELSNAQKKDSQDICFIPDGDYVKYITEYRGFAPEAGDYISTDGKILGRHKGQLCYTLGQRRGLGIALGRHMFVINRDAEKNLVTLGDSKELFTDSCQVESWNFIGCDSFDEFAGKELYVKIRYAHRGAAAVICGNTVNFREAQRAISKGQLAVVYTEDSVGRRIIAGGIIK